MLHGRVVRPRGQGAVDQGAKLLSVDKSSIKHIDGRRRSSSKGNFLGVVAPKEYDAIQAAAQLKVKWDETPTLLGQRQPRRGAARPGEPAGDAIAAQSGQRRRRPRRRREGASRQSYFTGLPGPRADRAELLRSRTSRADQATVLCMAQGPYTTRAGDRRPRSELPADRGPRPGLPGLGHPTATAPTTTPSISAALLSQAVGKPVRVQFMRWDEHGWDQFGPAQVTDIRAGIDANGKIVGYDYTSWQHGWTQVVESATQLAGVTAIPAAAPAGNADATSAGVVLRRSRTAASRASGSTATTASSRASGCAPPQRRSRCSPPSR